MMVGLGGTPPVVTVSGASRRRRREERGEKGLVDPVRVAQLPLHTGGRFSTKAPIPSWASFMAALATITPLV